MSLTIECFPTNVADVSKVEEAEREIINKIISNLDLSYDIQKDFFAELKTVLIEEINNDIVARAKEGDKLAKDRIVINSLSSVIKLAKRYNNLGVPFIDLIQEGVLGVFKAIEKFNNQKGAAFNSYAHYRIKQKIIILVTKQRRSVRLSQPMQESVDTLEKAKKLLTQTLQRDPSEQELADATDMQIEKVRECIIYKDIILDTVRNINGKEVDAMDNMEGDHSFRVEEKIDKVKFESLLEETLDILNPVQRFVIERRYAINGMEFGTLDEIKLEIGKSKNRVRQIELESLAKMNKFFARHGLKFL